MSRVLVSYFWATYVDGLGFVMYVRTYLTWIKGCSKNMSLRLRVDSFQQLRYINLESLMLFVRFNSLKIFIYKL